MANILYKNYKLDNCFESDRVEISWQTQCISPNFFEYSQKSNWNNVNLVSSQTPSLSLEEKMILDWEKVIKITHNS